MLTVLMPILLTFPCPHTGHLLGRGMPSKQNHMAETKRRKRATAGGPEAAALDSWFPSNTSAILPVSSLPCHPVICLPLTPPGAMQHSLWAGWPAGWLLGSCVEVGLLPAVSLCAKIGSTRSQAHPTLCVRLPRRQSWAAWTSGA